MSIDKNGNVLYMQSSNKYWDYKNDYCYASSHKGVIENGSDVGEIYFSNAVDTKLTTATGTVRSELAKYSPVKIKFSSDKKNLYVWADSDNFYAVTLERVDEDEYEDFIEEESVEEEKFFALWDGESESFGIAKDFWDKYPSAWEYSGRESMVEAPAVEAAEPAAYEYVEEAAVAPAEEPAAEPADDFGW